MHYRFNVFIDKFKYSYYKKKSKKKMQSKYCIPNFTNIDIKHTATAIETPKLSIALLVCG
jgi:hypothetical protein